MHALLAPVFRSLVNRVRHGWGQVLLAPPSAGPALVEWGERAAARFDLELLVPRDPGLPAGWQLWTQLQARAAAAGLDLAPLATATREPLPWERRARVVEACSDLLRQLAARRPLLLFAGPFEAYDRGWRALFLGLSARCAGAPLLLWLAGAEPELGALRATSRTELTVWGAEEAGEAPEHDLSALRALGEGDAGRAARALLDAGCVRAARAVLEAGAAADAGETARAGAATSAGDAPPASPPASADLTRLRAEALAACGELAAAEGALGEPDGDLAAQVFHALLRADIALLRAGAAAPATAPPAAREDAVRPLEAAVAALTGDVLGPEDFPLLEQLGAEEPALAKLPKITPRPALAPLAALFRALAALRRGKDAAELAMHGVVLARKAGDADALLALLRRYAAYLAGAGLAERARALLAEAREAFPGGDAGIRRDCLLDEAAHALACGTFPAVASRLDALGAPPGTRSGQAQACRAALLRARWAALRGEGGRAVEQALAAGHLARSCGSAALRSAALLVLGEGYRLCAEHELAARCARRARRPGATAEEELLGATLSATLALALGRVPEAVQRLSEASQRAEREELCCWPLAHTLASFGTALVAASGFGGAPPELATLLQQLEARLERLAAAFPLVAPRWLRFTGLCHALADDRDAALGALEQAARRGQKLSLPVEVARAELELARLSHLWRPSRAEHHLRRAEKALQGLGSALDQGQLAHLRATILVGGQR